MREIIHKDLVVFCIVLTLLLTGLFPGITGTETEDFTQIEPDSRDTPESQEYIEVTCYTFGLPGETSKQISITIEKAEYLQGKIEALQSAIAYNPQSDETNRLIQEIIAFAGEHNLLPKGFSMEKFKTDLIHTRYPILSQNKPVDVLQQTKASEILCNYVSTGSGSALPVIIFPRLIPVLLTPIPRFFVKWSVFNGITSCGGLLTGTGFIAHGQQEGLALGFWGIGFSVFLPPLMAYLLLGYALFVTVSAEEIEYWPPNNPPTISSEDPPDSSYDIPVSFTELKFQIGDKDGDSMNYTVTTEPDIGSGSGNNKKDGIYSVPISGLKPSAQYRWIVEVTDGEDTAQKEFSFITEELPFDPFDEGWKYHKVISINHTQVADDLTNFPVLVSNVDVDLRDKAQDDGDDILFMDGPGVAKKLYHEIERYDDSSGELIAWVNVVDVSADVDTILYIYYGKPSCATQQLPERVWDSNYMFVHHLGGSTYVDIEDSTINDNDVTGYSGTPDYQQLGKIGYGINFEDEYLSIPDSPTLDGLGSWTMEGWAYPTVYLGADREQRIMDKYVTYAFSLEDAGESQHIAVWCDGWEDSKDLDLGTDIWYHVVVTATGTAATYYLNGTLVDTDTFGVMPDTSNSLLIGHLEGYSEYFIGKIDELRLSDIARSPKWISTEYNNQNDPSSFLSFGPEETGP